MFSSMTSAEYGRTHPRHHLRTAWSLRLLLQTRQCRTVVGQRLGQQWHEPLVDAYSMENNTVVPVTMLET
jgi:hypothetical protein